MYVRIDKVFDAERDGTQIGRCGGDMGLCCIQFNCWQMQTDKGADIDTRHAKQIRTSREKCLHWLWKCTAVNVFYLLCLSKRRSQDMFMYSVCCCSSFSPLYKAWIISGYSELYDSSISIPSSSLGSHRIHCRPSQTILLKFSNVYYYFHGKK